MANFGIAEFLCVETESARERVRTRSSVARERLSTTEDCITVETLEPRGEPGTTVTATLEAGTALDITQARDYISQFVEFVDVPVFGQRGAREWPIPPGRSWSEQASWTERRQGIDLAGLATADIEVLGLADGQMRVLMENMVTSPPSGNLGRAALNQDSTAVRTLRTGFGLATVSVPSAYGWGGVIDLPALQPTAGREALESRSSELLQRLLSAVDDKVSELAIDHAESLESQSFLGWVASHPQIRALRSTVGACRAGRSRSQPSRPREARAVLWRVGSRDYSGLRVREDRPLVILSRRAPRRECELGYLRLTDAIEVSDQPQVLKRVEGSALSLAHGALAIRIVRVLLEDYFIDVAVQFAKMSHGVPFLVDASTVPVTVNIDPQFGNGGTPPPAVRQRLRDVWPVRQGLHSRPLVSEAVDAGSKQYTRRRGGVPA